MSDAFFSDPDLPQPAYLREAPYMADAFLGLVDYLWRQDDARRAFERDTDTAALVVAKSPLEAAIDQACGVEHAYCKRFLAWVVNTQWGAEGDPCLDDDA